MRAVAVSSLVLALAGHSLSQYNIDPNSVPMSLRQTWCLNQRTQCPLLCLQIPGNDASTRKNDCDPKTLSYSCVCASGATPNLTEYSQTIPFYQCQQFVINCVEDCGRGNDDCAYDCRADNPCGAQSPSPPNTTAASSPTGAPSASQGSPDAQETGAEDFADFNGNTGGNNGNGEGAATAAMNLGASYGLAVMVSGLFAGFAILL